MMALLLKSRAASSLLTVIAIFGGLFVWHLADKTSAVRKAVAEYVAQAELQALRASLSEVSRRQAVTDFANKSLEIEMEQAKEQAKKATRELEHYVSTVEDNCIVDPALRKRLRNG